MTRTDALGLVIDMEGFMKRCDGTDAGLCPGPVPQGQGQSTASPSLSLPSPTPSPSSPSTSSPAPSSQRGGQSKPKAPPYFPTRNRRYGLILYRLLQLYDRVIELLPSEAERNREGEVMRGVRLKAWRGRVIGRSKVGGRFVRVGDPSNQFDHPSAAVSQRFLLLSTWAM
ncbi:hypothetical protein KIPB_016225 [Kipferlia bialata]|uniref:Uncharacterized protein n=1 Tax=Kipferlia bialata TaxID=797122 RepID=A0A391P5D7_9EUKA|nr:hypothetical protein KIPB_016225 [Kipferlia bialata]|eukprot:g16225.t1